jgi:hypothetical protein
MTTLECLDASLAHFHLDYPRRVTRDFTWGEEGAKKLRDVCKPSMAARWRLRIYNGSGVIHAFGGLDYMMDVVRAETRCYSLFV